MRKLACLIFVALMVPAAAAAAERLPLFDCHIHYNAEAKAVFSPEQVLAWLREAGIERALVSSTPDDNSILLFDAAPNVVVPFWRPYRVAVDRLSWFSDGRTFGRATMVLQGRFGRLYRGIGEFHLQGSEADSETVRQIAVLAAGKGLVLHAHADAAAIGVLFDHAPDATIIWAHSGMRESVDVVRAALAQYPRLYGELSYRDGLTEEGRLTPQLRALLLDYPGRFVYGSDTWTTSRWPAVPALADVARAWLSQLPEAIARKIAYENARDLLGDHLHGQ